MYTTGKLKELRKKYHLTVYDMALKLGVSSSYYSQIENQRRRLYYGMAIQIASIFDLKPDEVFYEEQ